MATGVEYSTCQILSSTSVATSVIELIEVQKKNEAHSFSCLLAAVLMLGVLRSDFGEQSSADAHERLSKLVPAVPSTIAPKRVAPLVVDELGREVPRSDERSSPCWRNFRYSTSSICPSNQHSTSSQVTYSLSSYCMEYSPSPLNRTIGTSSSSSLTRIVQWKREVHSCDGVGMSTLTCAS